MAESSGGYSSVCVVGMMDHLWFHQVILFPEPQISSLFNPKHLVAETHFSPAQEEPSSSPDSCPTPTTPVEVSGEIEEEVDRENKERGTRLNSGLTPTERRVRRSCSTSPSAHSRPRPRKQSIKSSKRFQKSRSCRSFADLEMEEVRGFMDLGFIFKRENLSPRILSVVPGLQRLAVYGQKRSPPLQEEEHIHGINEEGGEEETPPVRPYLSEAWLIRRPNSPLLNLRVPRASPADEMKQHLRCWARTVASVMEQES